MKKYILYIITFFLIGNVSAQIEDGSMAPNFAVFDIDGNFHELYSYLQDGHTVVIFFMATWSDPCWSYHNGLTNGTNGIGALNVLHDQHSVENGGNVVVLMIEGDPLTNSECLIGGPGCNYTTHGDWSQDTPYDLIESSNIASTYEVYDFPTVMTICPNGFVNETGTSTADCHWDFIESSSCPDLMANDAALQYLSAQGTACEASELEVELVNLGTNELTAVNITSTGITPPLDYDWVGSLETFDSETIDFGAIELNQGEDVTITITEMDDNNDNNSISPFTPAVLASTHIHMELQSDTYPEDFSIHFFDEFENEVLTDGGWGGLGADVLIEEDYFLPGIGCYRVELRDSWGDGLFAGAHAYIHGIDSDGNAMDNIIEVIGGPEEWTEKIGGANANQIVTNVNEPDKAFSSLEVFPNPASESINLKFEILRPGIARVELVTALGDRVYSKSLGKLGTGNHRISVDLDDVASGMYLLNLSCDGKVKSERVRVD